MWIIIGIGQLDDLWFTTTQPLKELFKVEEDQLSGNKFLNNSTSI
jgi:hypothetical protein